MQHQEVVVVDEPHSHTDPEDHLRWEEQGGAEECAWAWVWSDSWTACDYRPSLVVTHPPHSTVLNPDTDPCPPTSTLTPCPTPKPPGKCLVTSAAARLDAIDRVPCAGAQASESSSSVYCNKFVWGGVSCA